MTGLYIAFEGLKGSGKSTLVAGVRADLRARGVTFAEVDPTRPSSPRHPWEALARLPGLRRLDAFEERLYAHRARVHARALGDGLTIGDRSVLTAVVSRWWRAGADRDGWVERCLAMTPALRPPDLAVLVDVPPELARARCRARARAYGRADETLDVLSATRDAYDELRTHPPRGLEDVRWHVLDGTLPAFALLAEANAWIHDVLARSQHV